VASVEIVTIGHHLVAIALGYRKLVADSTSIGRWRGFRRSDNEEGMYFENPMAIIFTGMRPLGRPRRRWEFNI
jgi:hypothetical protein